MKRENQGLRIVRAQAGAAAIVPNVAAQDIAAAVAGGTIVIVKRAFDPAELRRIRAAIVAWKSPDSGENQLGIAKSSRHRYEYPPGTGIKHVFESSLFAVNDPDDAIGPLVRGPFDRLADYWRSLTGCAHDFQPGADGMAVRAWAMYYPAGGGYFDWHEHPLLPQKVGLIVGMSQIGVDFTAGGTEFKTPFGVVDTMAYHDIGDVCLFRYDLAHRVTPIDPDRERRWEGEGRWTLVMPVQKSTFASASQKSCPPRPRTGT